MLDLCEASARLGLQVRGVEFTDLDAASHRLSEPGTLLIVLLGWGYLLPRSGLAALPIRLLVPLLGDGLDRIGHWVVVRRVGPADVELLDPYLGHVALARNRFAASWKMRALVVTRPGEEGGP